MFLGKPINLIATQLIHLESGEKRELHGGLAVRIWHCHCCGSGHCCGAGLIPGPENSACYGHGQNKRFKHLYKFIDQHLKDAFIPPPFFVNTHFLSRNTGISFQFFWFYNIHVYAYISFKNKWDHTIHTTLELDWPLNMIRRLLYQYR